MKLFGIMGKRHSGKDTCVYNVPDAIRYSFAAPLKESVKQIFELTDHQLNDPIQKESIDPRYNKSPREILQWFGTDCMRKFDNDFWIKKFVSFYEKHIESGSTETVIVTDVRFHNEADIIRKLGGVIIEITRPSIEHIHNKVTDLHISEKELELVKSDIVVVNDDTIETLQKQVLGILSEYSTLGGL